MRTNRSSASRRAASSKPVRPDDLTLGLKVFVAPELRGREHELIVVRQEDDSDDDYARRSDLLALAIEAARKS
jgi:hypothetical protein